MTIENEKYYELGRRTYWLMLLHWSTGTVIILLLALSFQLAIAWINLPFITVAFLNFFTRIALGLAVLAELIALFITWLEYGVHRVMLDNVSLHIVRGILSKHEVALPYRRIQSVEIQQTLVQRLLGVTHVSISTTTDLDHPNEIDDGSHKEKIPLADYELAQAVTSSLTNRAEVERIRMVK